jgi:hypothetical protein
MEKNQSNKPGGDGSANQLSFRSVFAHAWDFADGDIDAVMDSIGQMGLNTICMAGTYHSGWFIHPTNPKHRAFMTEGSVCYFHPHDALYQKTKLRPQVSKICQDKDWFGEVGKRLDHGLRLVSWTIGTHNTRLGLLHPELTQQNVYGDRIPHALCFVNSDVREYLKALCRDLATNYPLWGIQLESFGWMGFAHGHHHERDLVGLNSFEQDLMALCVCPACSENATKAGIEIPKVKATIKNILDGTFREAPQRPKNHPRTMAELGSKSPEVKQFSEWRKKYSDSFIREIKAESLKGSSCRLLLQSPFDSALADVADGFGCGAYRETPEQTLKICREAHASLPKNWNGLFQCFIQLGMGVPESEKQLHEIIEAVRNGGCNGINFYNHSESPPKMFGWLKNVLPQFANA